MENLGSCADLTGGQVEMVDMSRFSEEVGVILSNKTLATSLEVTVIVGGGATILEDDQDGLPRSKVAKRSVGVATMDTDLTFGINLRDLHLLEQEQPHHVPVQIQLRYVRLDGEEVLQVVTVLATVTEVRSVAESSINGTGIALQGIHKAARLAQRGAYREARSSLVSTCRLLQRGMRSSEQQEAYLAFIVQAEKLDGFMREREAQEK
eukprot:5956746-Amphidinium_carterae.1